MFVFLAVFAFAYLHYTPIHASNSQRFGGGMYVSSALSTWSQKGRSKVFR